MRPKLKRAVQWAIPILLGIALLIVWMTLILPYETASPNREMVIIQDDATYVFQPHTPIPTPEITPTIDPASSPTPTPLETTVPTPQPQVYSIYTGNRYLPPAPPVDRLPTDRWMINVDNANLGFIYAGYHTKDETVLAIQQGDDVRYHRVAADGQIGIYSLTMGSGLYEVTLYARQGDGSYRKVAQSGVQADIQHPTIPYLVNNDAVEFHDDLTSTQWVLENTTDSTTVRQDVELFVGWIQEYIAIVDMDTVQTVEETFISRQGSAWDRATLLASMCRSVGIPCKVVEGYHRINERIQIWNAVYIGDMYWIVDLSQDNAWIHPQDEAEYKSIIEH